MMLPARARRVRGDSHGRFHGRPHTILEYPEAGHSLGYLLPELLPGLLPREITDEASDKAARADAWPKAVEFIRKLGTTEG